MFFKGRPTYAGVDAANQLAVDGRVRAEEAVLGHEAVEVQVDRGLQRVLDHGVLHAHGQTLGEPICSRTQHIPC